MSTGGRGIPKKEREGEEESKAATQVVPNATAETTVPAVTTSTAGQQRVPQQLLLQRRPRPLVLLLGTPGDIKPGVLTTPTLTSHLAPSGRKIEQDFGPLG